MIVARAMKLSSIPTAVSDRISSRPADSAMFATGLELRMAYALHISNVENAGTNGHEPARGRRYSITATPNKGGNWWRISSLTEQAYRKAGATLIPEKEAMLLKLTASGDFITGGIDPSELFSLEEIQAMGLTEAHR